MYHIFVSDGNKYVISTGQPLHMDSYKFKKSIIQDLSWFQPQSCKYTFIVFDRFVQPLSEKEVMAQGNLKKKTVKLYWK